MAGTQTYVLDGKTYTVPEGTSLDELNGFIKQSDPLVSGEGMQEKAQGQAREQLASTIPPAKSMRQRFEPIAARNQTPEQKKFQAEHVVPRIQDADALGSLAVPFADAGGLVPGAIKLAGSTALGAGGAALGKRYFGAPGEVAGGVLGSLVGYGAAPTIVEGIANRFIGEPNVPMALRSPQTVGRMVEAGHKDFAQKLAAIEKARLEELGDMESFRTQHAEALMGRPDIEPESQSIRESPNFNATEYAAGKKSGGINPRGFTANVPTRMPEVARPAPELGSPENPGFQAKLPTRMPKIMTPKTTTNIGGEELPEIPGVIVAPEPRPLAPGEKPGSMYSVPRARLKGMAKTGKPGAVDVLRDIGQPSVLVPHEGVGYPGPRMGAPYLSPEELEQALRPRYRPAAD